MKIVWWNSTPMLLILVYAIIWCGDFGDWFKLTFLKSNLILLHLLWAGLVNIFVFVMNAWLWNFWKNLPFDSMIRGRSQTTLIRFSLFLTTYPPALTFYMVWTLRKNGHFWTTYLPRLVNVVCKQPVTIKFLKKLIKSKYSKYLTTTKQDDGKN